MLAFLGKTPINHFNIDISYGIVVITARVWIRLVVKISRRELVYLMYT